METSSKIVIFFLALVSIIVILFIYKNLPSNTPLNPQPQPGPLPGRIDCSVSPLTLKSCDKDLNICELCTCSGDSSLSGCMHCTIIEQNKPHYIESNQQNCVGEFVTWNSVEKKCQIKPRSYCLPTTINDISCNPFTSHKILIRADNGDYQWKCVCVDETQFGGEQCDIIKTCGMNSTSNPDSFGRGLVNKNNINDFWNINSVWDPFKDGKCNCAEGKLSDGLNCIDNPCGIYDFKDKITCSCGGNTINCKTIAFKSDIIPGTSYYTGICKMPSCVPDPCNTDNIADNKLNLNTNTCICDASKGYYPVIDTTLEFGQTCRKICDNSICENRGDCFVYQDIDKDTVWNIICVSNSSLPENCSITSSIVLKNGDKFLNRNFNIDKSIIDTFRFIPDNGESSQGTVINLYPNVKYFITTSDGKYLNFIQLKLVDDRKNATSIQLCQDDDCKDSQSFKLMIVTTKAFIGLDDTKSKLKNDIKPFKGTARCRNCKNSFTQDNNMMCQSVDGGSCSCDNGFIQKITEDKCKSESGYHPQCVSYGSNCVCQYR